MGWIVAPGLSALLALVVHEVAYLAAYPVGAMRVEALGRHAHLPTLWAVVTPIAVVAVAVFIIRQLRQLSITPRTGWRSVAAGGGALFALQETIEAAVHLGSPAAVITNPALWIGLAAVPGLAALMVQGLCHTSALIALFLRLPASLPRSAAIRSRPTRLAPVECRWLGSIPARGPPGSRF